MKHWFRVWEPRARGPSPNPRRLRLIVYMWERVHGRSVCVREPRQDLTLRALAQLNKLATLPLHVWTGLILQLGHTQTHILSSSRALQLSSKHWDPWFLYGLHLNLKYSERGKNLSQLRGSGPICQWFNAGVLRRISVPGTEIFWSRIPPDVTVTHVGSVPFDVPALCAASRHPVLT